MEEKQEKPFARIGADGVDTDAIMREIRETVARKKAEGIYGRYNLDGVDFIQVRELRDDAEFLSHIINIMNKSWEIDINDFEIASKGGLKGRIEVLVKKVIWKLLKFYTYRMWSQQNQVNGLLVTAIESLDGKYRARIENLERRLAAAEPLPNSKHEIRNPK